jgi:hypothetical protein
MPKIIYAINANTPTNHADRPLFVTNIAVRVATTTITTAPGQMCRSIGAGANQVTHSALPLGGLYFTRIGTDLIVRTPRSSRHRSRQTPRSPIRTVP